MLVRKISTGNKVKDEEIQKFGLRVQRGISYCAIYKIFGDLGRFIREIFVIYRYLCNFMSIFFSSATQKIPINPEYRDSNLPFTPRWAETQPLSVTHLLCA